VSEGLEAVTRLKEAEERVAYLEKQLELGRRILAMDLSPVAMKLALEYEYDARIRLIEAGKDLERSRKHEATLTAGTRRYCSVPGVIPMTGPAVIMAVESVLPTKED
jgi:hypothetical protein